MPTDQEQRSEEIRQLLFQMDGIFHNRINSLIVAETIFFAGAATAWTHRSLVVVLCVLGLMTTLGFTYTNLKLYWRLTWLISEYKKSSPLYRDYLELPGIADLSPGWGFVTRWLQHLSSIGDDKGPQRRWLDTGWLYTW